MLVLVRHGETRANAGRRLSGRGEVPLTEAGRAQVRQLADALGTAVGPVAALVSSPLGRAVETARGLGLDCPLEIDERWTEVDYGDFEGLALGEVPVELWSRWREDPAYAPPGGESLTAVRRRVEDACAELLAAPGGRARGDRAVVVVSHVSPIKAAVTWALGCRDDAVWRLHLSTGSLTILGWSGSGPLLHVYNWRPTLPTGELRRTGH